MEGGGGGAGGGKGEGSALVIWVCPFFGGPRFKKGTWVAHPRNIPRNVISYMNPKDNAK